MFKLTTFALALGLLLTSGCAAHDQRVALQESCNTGSQAACQQLAADESPAPYPPDSTIHVMPGGGLSPGSGGLPPGGVHVGGIGGMGGMGGGLGGIGGGIR